MTFRYFPLLVLFFLLPYSVFANEEEREFRPHEAVKLNARYGHLFAAAEFEFGHAIQFSGSYFLAVAMVESDGKEDAVSESNARCLMQLKDSALRDNAEYFPGRHFGDDIHDPRTCIMHAAAYFYQLANRYNHVGTCELLVAYRHGIKKAGTMTDPCNDEYVRLVEKALAAISRANIATVGPPIRF